jgi:hypothetical protein
MPVAAVLMPGLLLPPQVTWRLGWGGGAVAFDLASRQRPATRGRSLADCILVPDEQHAKVAGFVVTVGLAVQRICSIGSTWSAFCRWLHNNT